MAERQSQTSSWKTLLGGIIALGVLVALFGLGKFAKSESALLKSDLENGSEISVNTDDSGGISVENEDVKIQGDSIEVSPENSAPEFDQDYTAVYPRELDETMDNFAVYAYVSDADGVDDLASVVLDLSPIGQSPTTMIESEIDGNGRIFGLENIVFPDPPQKSNYPLRLTASDKSGNTTEYTIDLKLGWIEPEVNEPEIPAEVAGENLQADLNETPSENIEVPENNLEPQEEEKQPISAIVLNAATENDGIHLHFENPVSNELESFNIYYASESGKYIHRIEAGYVNDFVFGEGQTEGKSYFFTVTAIDQSGNEGLPSAEISAYLPTRSAQPVVVNYGEVQQAGLHAVAPDEPSKPQVLSQEGPKEILLLSILLSLGITGFFWGKKFARN